MSRSKRVRTEASSPASTAIRSAWESSAPPRRIARRICARVCRSARLRPAAATSTRRLICWSGDWPGTVCWSTASGARDNGEDQVVIEPQVPIIGRKRRSSAMPTFSSCRGSPICAGAATRWSWNRRAPARCSGFAIRRLRPPWPCCRRRSRSNGSVGRTVFPGSSCSLCWWIAKSCSRSTLRATAGCGRPRVTTTSFFGTFTIFCSTRAARKAGTPTRWAGFIPMRASCLRRRRCGRAGRERKSICARSRPRFATQSRRSQSSCVNVIRRAASMTSDRSRSPSLRGFSTAPRASSRNGAAGSTSATTVPMVAYAVRPYPSGGGSYELELYLAVDKCEGLARGFLSLRRRRTRAGADRRPRA